VLEVASFLCCYPIVGGEEVHNCFDSQRRWVGQGLFLLDSYKLGLGIPAVWEDFEQSFDEAWGNHVLGVQFLSS